MNMYSRMSSLGMNFSSGLQKEVSGDGREVLLLSREWVWSRYSHPSIS